ncbi:MAG: hypothetical protein M0D57_07880 [Sphingobacteriales bacterium JAD_PAG50586_3]|nr:MAG: hypothetical protein M0D57_07880 [Sphingobacteriales bacterium JAD_PAG50586_3]
MKRNVNAAAVAHNQSVHNSKKVVKAVVAKATYTSLKENKVVDHNKLSADELAMVKNIDAHLQDLYYLTDEEDIIGFC